MKNRKRIVKSLALVALASTFAIAIAADSGTKGNYYGSASASESGASASISYASSASSCSTSSTFEAYATIGNSLGWVRDEDSGATRAIASVSASSLNSIGGAAQSSRAVAWSGDVVYEDYWS